MNVCMCVCVLHIITLSHTLSLSKSHSRARARSLSVYIYVCIYILYVHTQTHTRTHTHTCVYMLYVTQASRETSAAMRACSAAWWSCRKVSFFWDVIRALIVLGCINTHTLATH
jgi:hypothetical protein